MEPSFLPLRPYLNCGDDIKPPLDCAADPSADEDLAQRIRHLFADVDGAMWLETAQDGSKTISDRLATIEDWQRLAIGLAVRHKEPGFNLYTKHLQQKRPAEDDDNERDHLIDSFLSMRTCPKTGEKMTQKLASKLAYEVLNDQEKIRKQRFIKGGGAEADYKAKKFSAEGLRTAFAARRSKTKSSGPDASAQLPSYLRLYVAHTNIFKSLMRAARILSSQPPLQRRGEQTEMSAGDELV